MRNVPKGCKIYIKKEKGQFLLFADNLGDPKETSRRLFDLLNTFNQVERYIFNTQKSVAFLHTNKEHEEKEGQGGKNLT